MLKQFCAAHVRKRLGDTAIVRDWLGYEDRSSRMRYRHAWLRPQYRRQATAERLKDFGALAA